MQCSVHLFFNEILKICWAVLWIHSWISSGCLNFPPVKAKRNAHGFLNLTPTVQLRFLTQSLTSIFFRLLKFERTFGSVSFPCWLMCSSIYAVVVPFLQVYFSFYSFSYNISENCVNSFRVLFLNFPRVLPAVIYVFSSMYCFLETYRKWPAIMLDCLYFWVSWCFDFQTIHELAP